jgi:hypothetical protein
VTLAADTWTTDLLEGIAAYVSASGIGTWRPGGGYTAAEQPVIAVGSLADDFDRGIGLRVYSPQVARRFADIVQPVQFYLRGARDAGIADVEQVGGKLFNLLDSAQGYDVGGIRIVQSWLNSAAPLGVDSEGRETAAHNYYFRAQRYTASRTF